MKVLDSKIIVKLKKGITQKMGNLEFPIDSEYEVAEVIEVGPDIMEGTISVGDTVFVYVGAGKTVTVEGVQYQVITKNEIIIVL